MDKNQCQSCQHFLQHYTFDRRKIFRVHCGHCAFSQARRKLPGAKACENYAPGAPQEDAFVSKEYLSKELLRYVLSLELLPKIEE